jgi:hypothetical protein
MNKEATSLLPNWAEALQPKFHDPDDGGKGAVSADPSNQSSLLAS